MRKSVHSKAELQLRTLLRNAREKAGLRQADVANRLARPQSFVAKYEQGERRLDLIEFVTIARLVGADPVKILKTILKGMGE